MIAAVESLWQELCRIEMEENEALAAGTPEPAIEPPADELEPPEDEPPQEPEASDAPEEATDQEGESPTQSPQARTQKTPMPKLPRSRRRRTPLNIRPAPGASGFTPIKRRRKSLRFC